MSSPLLQVEITDNIACLEINRPEKRNAMNDELLSALGDFFSKPPENVRLLFCLAGVAITVPGLI